MGPYKFYDYIPYKDTSYDLQSKKQFVLLLHISARAVKYFRGLWAHPLELL